MHSLLKKSLKLTYCKIIIVVYSSTSFNTCIGLCNQHHNQDTEHSITSERKKTPWAAPLQNPAPTPECWQSKMYSPSLYFFLFQKVM